MEICLFSHTQITNFRDTKKGNYFITHILLTNLKILKKKIKINIISGISWLNCFKYHVFHEISGRILNLITFPTLEYKIMLSIKMCRKT